MPRISQPNARILLGLSSDVNLKYIYDGYTHSCEYKPIRKSKARKEVRKAFHTAGISRERAQEDVAKLVQLDEIVNAKTYDEAEVYLNTMFEDVHYPYGPLCSLSNDLEDCDGLRVAYDYVYRYISENY